MNERELDVIQTVARVSKILSSAKKWNQGPAAIGAGGESIDELPNSGAVSFCLYGAILQVCGDETGHASNDTYVYLTKVAGADWSGLIEWNEKPGRTFAQVRRLLDSAAKDYEPRYVP